MNESPVVSDSSTMSVMGRQCVAIVDMPSTASFTPIGSSSSGMLRSTSAANVPDRSSAANSIIDRAQLVMPLVQIAQPLVPAWMKRNQDNSGPARPRSSSLSTGGRQGRVLTNNTADRIANLQKGNIKVKVQGLKDKSPNRDDISDSSGGKSPRCTSSLTSIT